MSLIFSNNSKSRQHIIMAPLRIGNLSIGYLDDPVFVIAEIGQNHQGNINIAKKLIKEAKKIGCNCVKFQRSTLSSKFTRSALDRPYTGRNSWGRNYFEHKAYLEFSFDEYAVLKTYSDKLGIYFSASAMDEVSLAELHSLNLPFIKIGSGDANNFMLLEKAAQIKCPLLISTGMQSMKTIESVVQVMRIFSKTNFALLHCVSSYPTKSEDCSLVTITMLKNKFPDVLIGYSGHEVAPFLSEAAVLLGAKIVERHITLDKAQKGSDHSCSLTPIEFSSLIKRIRYYEDTKLVQKQQELQFIIKHFNNEIHVQKSLTIICDKRVLDCELVCRTKLGKSLVTSKRICEGEILTVENISIKVCEPLGITAEKMHYCLGKVAKKDIEKDSPIMYGDI